MSSEEEDSQRDSSSEEDNSDSNSDSENSSESESEASDAEDAPSGSDDDDTPKEEPLPPMPTFERRKREPPNPEIPWVSAIPLANELDEMQTRIKQLEFSRDEDVTSRSS